MPATSDTRTHTVLVFGGRKHESRAYLFNKHNAISAADTTMHLIIMRHDGSGGGGLEMSDFRSRFRCADLPTGRNHLHGGLLVENYPLERLE